MQTTQAIPRTHAARIDLVAALLPGVCAAMLAMAAAFVALRVMPPGDGLLGAYVTSSWSERGMLVEPLPGSGPSGVEGLTVAGVEGRSLDAWLADLLSDVPRPIVGAGIGLTYIVADDLGRPREAVVPMRPFPIFDTLLENWSTLVWVVAMALTGTYLFLRRPREPATQALMVLGSAVLASSVPWMLGVGPADLVRGGAAVPLFLVATFVTYLVFWSAAVHFALVFPRPLGDGRQIGRIVALAYAAPLGLQLAWVVATAPGSTSTLGWIGGWTGVQLVIVMSIIAVLVALLVTQWRRAGREDRDRLRWIVGAAMVAAVGVLVGWYLPEALTTTPLLPWSAVGLVGMAFPVAFGVAVRRHALFGIETVVHRSLVYGGLTAGVVAVYAASVILLGSVLPGEGPYAVTLLATGAAALVALPLRDRLQRFASRLVYGDRDEPYRAIARLAERVESSLQPSAVLPMVAETVAEALKLPYAAIELRRDGGSFVAAFHGTPRPVVERIPLAYRGEAVGALVLAPRAPDEPFSPADRRLLVDLARQAGAAAHSVRLLDELQRSREGLVTTREEERRRLRRELHDGIGPALAGSLMKLESARAMLADDPSGPVPLLDGLAADTRRMIDEVRRLAYDLRPPALDQLGLIGTLRQEAERLGANGTEISVAGTGVPDGLPAAVEVAAYRIALEAMTNVIHHADARHAWVLVEADATSLTVHVRDDGRGMARDAGAGVGLSSMRERVEELGGTLEVATGPKGGVSITARLPRQVATDHG